MIINLYPNIGEASVHEKITINDFLNKLQHGFWKNLTDRIAAVKDKKERQLLKKRILPYVTVSGTFKYRNLLGLDEHSGFITMDFDDLYADTDRFFDLLKADPFSFAVCRSVSGTGLFVLVKIDGKKHLDAFLALEDYYMQKYALIVDQNCKDIPRARFISYDPALFVNKDAQPFKNYLPKREIAKLQKQIQFVYSGTDIDFVMKQIDERGVDLTDSDYKRMLTIGFAFQAEFGEGGRQHFHQVCSKSAKYDQAVADKQYSYIMRSQRSGISMGSFFYLAKEAGLQTFTKETVKAATIAKQVKKSGRGMEAAKRQIEMAGLDQDEAEKVIEQIFSGKELKGADSECLIGQMEIFLSLNYHMKRNDVTRMIELKGVPMEELQFNSIYIHLKKVVDEKVNFQDLTKLILSDFTEGYNPLHAFFDTYQSRKTETGHIKALAASVTTSTGFADDGCFDPDFFHYFLTKWLVGIVASVFGEHSPLVLVLMGGQNAGKTEFFRRLMPAALMTYYAESKLDEGKDSEILMCKKILVMDDEYGGKSKKDEKRMKELSSKQVFTVREPYGKASVDLRRLAVLCGTTNEDKILNDPTGNRRIIPIQVEAIDHEAYNAVDKIGLFMEAFHLWQTNTSHHLNRDDIKRLNENTKGYEAINAEFELIGTLFRHPAKKRTMPETVEFLTLTQIKGDIERHSGQRLNVYALGKAMQALEYRQIIKKLNGSTQRVYEVIRTNVAKVDEPDREVYTLKVQATPTQEELDFN